MAVVDRMSRYKKPVHLVMNTSDIGVLLVAFTLGMFTYLIFRDFWFTSYGVKLPFKNVRFKWSLLIPLPLIGFCLTSFFKSGWLNPFDEISRVCVLAIIITAAIQLCRWHMAPNAHDITLDVAVLNKFPKAMRRDPEDIMHYASANLQLYETSDVYYIADDDLNGYAKLYAEFLRSNDHIVQNTPFKLSGVRSYGIRFDAVTFTSLTDEIWWVNKIIHDPNTGIVVFQSQPTH